jgi:hypothetical protein
MLKALDDKIPYIVPSQATPQGEPIGLSKTQSPPQQLSTFESYTKEMTDFFKYGYNMTFGLALEKYVIT